MPLSDEKKQLLELALAVTPRYINRNQPSQVTRYYDFLVVVPVNNPNSHDYPIGQPFMIIPRTMNEENNYGTGFLKINGYRGNFINAAATKYATPAEVEKFVTNLPDEGMDVVSSVMTTVEAEEEE